MRASLTAVLAAATVALAAQSPLPVGNLAISAPETVAEIDLDKVKGQASRLSWSADGRELYLQTIEGTFGQPTAKTRHYVLAVAGGGMKDVNAEPAWAAAYWQKKSHRASPDDPAMQIALDTGTRTERTAGVATGGDLARGGVGGGGEVGGGAGGTSAGDAIAAAAASQTVTVHTMKLAKEPIGEFVNSVIVPGLTFGWGPSGSKAIAYTQIKGGKVVIMDLAGKKQEVEGSKDAILPAWSPDGSKLAWLRKDGRKKLQLQIANVAAR